METAKSPSRTDEAALYLTTGVALAAASLAVGAGAGSARLGLIAAGLSAAGVFMSWRTRAWTLPRALSLGLLVGVVAAGSLQSLIRWESATEESVLYLFRGDPGLALAFRMTLLVVALSFVLIRTEVLPFSLVPAISAFGLVGGRGYGTVVGSCFAVFLPAALCALGQAMLVVSLADRPASAHRRRHPREWRKRHRAGLALLSAVVMLLGYLLFIPMVAYGTQYAFSLPVEFRARGWEAHRQLQPTRDEPRSFPVGRGPVLVSDAALLSIEGDPAEYWRSETFAHYTGDAWRQLTEGARNLPVARGDVDLTAILPADPHARVETHTVRAEVELPLVVIAPGQIQRLVLPPRLARALAENGVQIDQSGCVRAPDAVLPAGARYHVVSAPLDLGIRSAELSGAPPGMRAGLIDESYLNIPLSARNVADLAREVAGREEDPLDRLGALIAYLQASCAYTREAPAIPHGEDAADYFLFRLKRGHCDLFATALAVMGRAVGIPMRVATGYAGGQYDAERDRYILRESDAHAWVEAYLPEWGWVAADATPAGELPPIPPVQRALLSVRFFCQDNPLLCLTLVGLLAAAMVAVLVRVWRARRGPAIDGRGRAGPRTVVVQAYARLCHILARAGRSRRASQTPFEFVAALESGGSPGLLRGGTRLPVGALGAIRALSETFVSARYGRGPVSREMADSALSLLAEVRESLRRGTPDEGGSSPGPGALPS